MANKINDFLWEIGTDAQQGMRVPIHIYANEKVATAIGKDRTLKQAMNSASLPSIVKHMLLMPDAHEGYGFPVGGVAAFDAENGIISPGVVGYDINCLHPDTKIYDRHGSWIAIKYLEKLHDTQSFDLKSNTILNTEPLLGMHKSESGNLFRFRTASGKELCVTADHPILTRNGMVNAAGIRMGNCFLVNGFEGNEHKEPANDVIVCERELLAAMDLLGIGVRGSAREQILAKLKSLGLLTLRYNSEKLPLLLKLVGFELSDGSLPKNSTAVAFYGKKADLESARKDILELGFKATIRSRKREHKIITKYGKYEFGFEEHSLCIGSRSFRTLLVALGVPIGNRSSQRYEIPKWVKTSELWQKRLFLAAYFGGEMSKPLANNGYNFMEPAFSVSKLSGLEDDAMHLLLEFKAMLKEFSIECLQPAIVDGYEYNGVKGRSVGVRLAVLSETSNLIKLFGRIGFVYNKEKERLASIASLYLGYLTQIRKERDEARCVAINMHKNGLGVSQIVQMVGTKNVTRGFIEHSVWADRGKARVWGAIRFDEFCRKNEVADGYIFDEVVEIGRFKYVGNVYDLTINDCNHNFLADGIIVSNCGVRLIKTNMRVEDVKPKLSQLMDMLFKNIPSGVGSRINLGFTRNDLNRVCSEGVRYIVDKGFGTEEDIAHIEENGCMQGADMGKVSPFAAKRGTHELGTLGAGNHFLEVQKVDSIHDERAAKGFGLEKGMVVILVHSGSRGFGHQVCSDYLRIFADYQSKNHIVPPDPELVYAYANTKEAESYLQAMKSAVNFAFVNRQIMTNSIRKSFSEVFGKSADALGMELVYDVAHNIVKVEEHDVDGKRMKLYVHRKGATRAFGPGRQEVPQDYRQYGQPVIIPGSMGTASYVLAGRDEAMKETFGSSCHGSGRVMSRHQAQREIPVSKILDDLKSKGIELRVRNMRLVSEEAEWAYKNVDDVVNSIAGAKISDIVAKLVPMGVAKG